LSETAGILGNISRISRVRLGQKWAADEMPNREVI